VAKELEVAAEEAADAGAVEGAAEVENSSSVGAASVEHVIPIGAPPLRLTAELVAAVRGLAAQVAVLQAQIAKLLSENEHRAREQDPLMSLDEFARALRKRKQTVMDWVASGRLKGVDVGGKHPRFRRADLDLLRANGLKALTQRAPRRKTDTVAGPPRSLEEDLKVMKEAATLRQQTRQAQRALRGLT
jgi:excisionase family DNA binding protein